jgi:hypothetical protein
VAPRIPLKLTWGIVAACLILGEAFPFSRFPMYAVLPATEFYFHLADEAGRPIPAKPEFGLLASHLKKLHRSTRNQVLRKRSAPAGAAAAEQDAEAGRRLLERLLRDRRAGGGDPPRFRELRLYRVRIEIRDGAVARRRELVASVAAGPGP